MSDPRIAGQFTKRRANAPALRKNMARRRRRIAYRRAKGKQQKGRRA